MLIGSLQPPRLSRGSVDDDGNGRLDAAGVLRLFVHL